MFRPMKAKLQKVTQQGTYLTCFIPHEDFSRIFNAFSRKGVLACELRFDDNRVITPEQRAKIYATFSDISDCTGHDPYEVKQLMKNMYVGKTGEKWFSLSNCSVTTARRFLSCMLDFALDWDIPLSDILTDRTDDIDAALLSALHREKCVICGRPGEVHHWDAIGMGRDRTKYDDSRHRVIELCRGHHTEAEQIGRDTFAEKYHVYGIVFKAGG